MKRAPHRRRAQGPGRIRIIIDVSLASFIIALMIFGIAIRVL